ncbi:MAG: LPS export ABC transporter periplasmic protein LptC [Methyloligellaceae bacterium]
MPIPHQNLDRSKAIKEARRHSRKVVMLRMLLPVCAIAVACLYMIPEKIEARVGKQGVISFDPSFTGKLLNPKYSGFDKKNGKYVVQAAYALPNLKKPNIVKLHKIQADAENSNQGWIKMDAAEGVYDSKKESLSLSKSINIATDKGLTARMLSASVNMKTQIIQSKQPVNVKMPNGTVDAHGLTFDASASLLTFQKNVRVSLVNNKPPSRRPARPKEGPGAMFQNNREPINITSNLLQINNKIQTAVFQGQVSASQSNVSLQANSLQVNYKSGGKQTKTDGSQSIKEIVAQDNVLIQTANGQQATAQTSIFDNEKQLVTLLDGVTVKQGQNSLTGQKLIIDMNKRHSYFPPGGRVNGIFIPPADTKKKRRPKKKAKAGAPTDSLVQSFSSFASQSNDPLNVTSNRLDIFDLKKTAIFRGNVEVKRGDNSIRSGYLKLDYVGSAPISGRSSKAAGPSQGTQIRKIIAKNKVLIATPNNQNVTSDQAVFNVASNIVVISGNVVLTQGDNVLKGSKLVINLNTGKYDFETGGDRVRAVFTPKNFNIPGQQK